MNGMGGSIIFAESTSRAVGFYEKKPASVGVLMRGSMVVGFKYYCYLIRQHFEWGYALEFV